MGENLELAFIKTSYMAEIIAATGTEELMDKGNRPYIGMYDKSTRWFVPLRANVTKTRKENAVWLTPFETSNPHYRNPGLDFMKAVYVPEEEDIHKIKNTLPEKQWDYINKNQQNINNAFTNYVLWVDELPDSERDKKWSTVPLFPKGIQSIRERLIAEEIELNQSLYNDIGI
ncbi:hypothetical protein [Fructobacillus fructosus]|uniref:hypothetical protein n=1 Tax=Fructobacillus fructosus TaxID=1631 RepID=UPI001658A78C|nr:hypothetical protein [Fructobacillus fructosus]MBC9119308.1 hypothetical protein [Fructobacillus fructosus]MBD9366865.1 hypothetical protein [Leuconostoc mesenteroides]